MSDNSGIRVTRKTVDFYLETHGLDSLEQSFNNLRYADKRKIIMNAFRKAVKPMVDQATSNAPMGRSGNLKRSVGTIPYEDEVALFVGARKGGSADGRFAGYHGHLLNDGTVSRQFVAKNNKVHPIFMDVNQLVGFYRTKPGQVYGTGNMKTTGLYSHWFTRAKDATKQQAIDIVKDEWYREISKFIIINDRKDN